MPLLRHFYYFLFLHPSRRLFFPTLPVFLPLALLVDNLGLVLNVVPGRFTLSSVRLAIRAFHFFSEPSIERTSGILQTYFISTDLIEAASSLNESRDFWVHCDMFQARAIALAAVCILRVLRSSLRTQVNSEIGEEMFFNAIRMSKKRSVRNNDLHARNDNILTQLWSSSQVFKFKDGSVDGLRLLLRGRLVSPTSNSHGCFADHFQGMSVFFDCLWWWRTEFGGTSNPYIEPDSIRASHLSSTETATESSNAATWLQRDPNTASELASTNLSLAALPNLLVDASDVLDWNFGANLDW